MGFLVSQALDRLVSLVKFDLGLLKLDFGLTKSSLYFASDCFRRRSFGRKSFDQFV
jgi:hypothetical protein